MRELTPEESVIVKELYQRKQKRLPMVAYVTTTQPLSMSRWNGIHPVDENTTKTPVPVGSTLKIILASGMGDCCLTDNMEAEVGYGLRLDWDSDSITNIRWKP